MLTFIFRYMNGEFEAIHREAIILIFPYVAVLIAIVIDLAVGVMKTKAAGEAHTSLGLRGTVSKFKDYYSLLLVSSLIDVLLSVMESYSLPFLTFGGALYLVVIEWISIREKWEVKNRKEADKDMQLILSVLEHRGDLVSMLVDIIKKETGEGKDKEEENNEPEPTQEKTAD